MPNTPSEKKMPSTAPSAAPDEAPRISGDTSGLRNRPWKAVPATASAAPTNTAASTRGPRTSSTTFSTAGRAHRCHPRAPGKPGERSRMAPDGEGNDKPDGQRRQGNGQAGEEGAVHGWQFCRDVRCRHPEVRGATAPSLEG